MMKYMIILAIFLLLLLNNIGCANNTHVDITDRGIKNPINTNSNADTKTIGNYCENYPHGQIIDWQYLANVDFQGLAEQEHKFLTLTDEVIEFAPNVQYQKIRARGDGDCFERAGNLAVLERLLFGQGTDNLSKVKERLTVLWPYRKKSLGDPGVSKFELLLDYLGQSKNVKSLLDKVNHPCIDMALDWLVRDLSWAFENREYNEALKSSTTGASWNLGNRDESEKGLKHRAWVGGGDKWVRFYVWRDLFGGIAYSRLVDEKKPTVISPYFIFSQERELDNVPVAETRTLLFVPSSVSHVDLLIKKNLV
jgi:hypothetical protein